MSQEKKVCLISSAGGHFEQLKMLQLVAQKYNTYFVLPKNRSLINVTEKKYMVMDIIRKSKVLLLFSLSISAFQQFVVFLIERPDVVITTGAGVAVPTCLYAHFFSKKVIYIESFARMKSLNKTGQILLKFSDLYVVQWEELLKLNPNAVYGGWLY